MVHQAVLEASRRLGGDVRVTPLERSPVLGRIGDCRAYLKLENCQRSGSFKIRGATNKIRSLGSESGARRIVTASSGNHGAAVGHVLRDLGRPGTVYVAESAAPEKLDALRALGVEVRVHGSDCVDAETYGRQAAERAGDCFVPPYNDLQVIAGQGTIAVELVRQLGEMDAVLVPVGGGGLISGIAGYLKAIDERIEIIGCQPERSAVMCESVRARKIVRAPTRATLSDGTAGGIEPGSITFELCRRLVDEFVLVSEDEIRDAIRWVLREHHMLIEGAAALSVAAFIRQAQRFRGQSVVLILSGARIGIDSLSRVLGIGR